MIKIANENDLEVLTNVALGLWSTQTFDSLNAEFRGLMAAGNCVFFMAYDKDIPVGFAQCSKRYDYVEGCDYSPVGYLEGIYIDKNYRKLGYSKDLLLRCEQWAKQEHCREFASDCEADNLASHKFHLANGFKEANRVICFVKKL